MKVLVVGLTKTDVSTLLDALSLLPGLNTVYHYMEQYEYMGKDWLKICKDGEKIDQLRGKYKDVDVVADLPAAYFWEELHAEYPESKVSFVFFA